MVIVGAGEPEADLERFRAERHNISGARRLDDNRPLAGRLEQLEAFVLRTTSIDRRVTDQVPCL